MNFTTLVKEIRDETKNIPGHLKSTPNTFKLKGLFKVKQKKKTEYENFASVDDTTQLVPTASDLFGCDIKQKRKRSRKSHDEYRCRPGYENFTSVDDTTQLVPTPSDLFGCDKKQKRKRSIQSHEESRCRHEYENFPGREDTTQINRSIRQSHDQYGCEGQTYRYGIDPNASVGKGIKYKTGTEMFTLLPNQNVAFSEQEPDVQVNFEGKIASNVTQELGQIPSTTVQYSYSASKRQVTEQIKQYPTQEEQYSVGLSQYTQSQEAWRGVSQQFPQSVQVNPLEMTALHPVQLVQNFRQSNPQNMTALQPFQPFQPSMVQNLRQNNPQQFPSMVQNLRQNNPQQFPSMVQNLRQNNPQQPQFSSMMHTVQSDVHVRQSCPNR